MRPKKVPEFRSGPPGRGETLVKCDERSDYHFAVTGRKLSGPMRFPLRLVSARPLSLRRLWALGLMLFLGALFASPLWEREGQVRMGAHLEQQGTRHAEQHREETCEVCGARALQATSPAPVAVAVEYGVPSRVELVRTVAGPSRIFDHTGLSRAPPASV